MKQQAFRIIATVGLFMACATAAINAQAQSAERMIINIPFAFSASNQELPAGEYSVKRISQNSSAFVIQSQDGRSAVIVLAHDSLQDDQQQARAKLVFHNYHGRYFLSQVWMLGYDIGNQVLESRAERTLRRELARKSAQPQQVALIPRQ